MSIRIAINGFGRIGRLVFRIIKDNNLDVDVVGINDLTDAKTLAHLLKFDSTHHRFSGVVSIDGNNLIVNGDKTAITAEKQIENLPWSDIDIVVESTGKFTTKADCEKHLKHAKKVILTAPAKDALDASVVLGVNEDLLTGKEKTLSNASCTTNCLAPMVKVLNDAFGIERGFMTTVHAYTNDQNILDLPHKDLRRTRAAAMNIIPTTTGAAKAVSEVIPEVKGRLDGLAFRVPVSDGSVTDLTVVLSKTPSKDDVNAAFREAANTSMLGILEYTEDQLVSSDIIGNSHSCIFDSSLTMVSGNTVKVVGWYDNEWGYSNRIVDLLMRVAR
ncbi:MAG: type I glyceraldehyde-3-phosphate dehydrogenase [Ignavibacteria bacterium]|nr:type I glyceraldehyde-3-phosphate dehydrogenase [Ignavibacteria bacterium]